MPRSPSLSQKLGFTIKDRKLPLRVLGDLRRFPLHLMDAYVEGGLEIHGPLTPLFMSIYEIPKRLGLAPLFCRWQNSGSSDSSSHARDVRHHYDLETPFAENKVDATAFYRLWLDDSLTYTMGYWPPETRSLEQAQINKNRLYQQLARIGPGHDVYEPGFGFGSFIPYVLEKQASWHGANLSSHQCRWVRDKHPALEVREQDFVTPWLVNGSARKFDRIVSIGNLEHVQNLDGCFRAFREMLKSDGLLFVHLITLNQKGVFGFSDPWLTTRIFPNGTIYTHEAVTRSASPYFRVEEQRVLPGLHYQKTLHEWLRRFDRAREELEALGAPARLVRLWRAYLAASEASFAQGFLRNSAIVFRPR